MISAIIGAAGKSERFGTNKLKAILGGVPLLMRSLYLFQVLSEIDEIILVGQKEELAEMTPLKKSFPKIKKIIAGGKTRFQSITKGVLVSQGDLCLVHNGANPLVTKEEILKVLKVTKKHGAAFVGRKVKSTLWEIKDEKIDQEIPRKNVYEAETPQAFKKDLYLQALEKIKNSPKNFTDEMSVLKTIKINGILVLASKQNIKITTSQDLQIAENFLKPYTRIGIGHDSHHFNVNNTKKDLVLGGVIIDSNLSLKAESDGDLVIHALCNAIGTAIGEGSLSLYADKLLQKKNIIDSSEYLKYISTNMTSLGYKIGNIALSIEGKKPRLEKYIPDMKEKLARVLAINPFQIGLAVTSGEELTSFGKGVGLQCFAYVQIIKI